MKHDTGNRFQENRRKFLLALLTTFMVAIMIGVGSGRNFALGQTEPTKYSFKELWSKNIPQNERDWKATLSKSKDQSLPSVLVNESGGGRKTFFDINGIQIKQTKFSANAEVWPNSSQDRFIVYKGNDAAVTDMQLLDENGDLIKDLTKDYGTTGTAFFSGKGNYFAVIGPGVEFFDKNGNRIGVGNGTCPDAAKGAFSPDENYFGLELKQFSLWKTNGEKVLQYPFNALSFGISKNDSFIVLASLKELVIIDQKGNEIFRKPYRHIGVTNIQFINNDEFAFSDTDTLWLGKISTKTIRPIKNFLKTPIAEMKVVNANILLSYGNNDYGKIEYLTPAGGVLASKKVPSWARFSTDGEYLSVSGKGFLKLFRLEKK